MPHMQPVGSSKSVHIVQPLAQRLGLGLSQRNQGRPRPAWLAFARLSDLHTDTFQSPPYLHGDCRSPASTQTFDRQI